ncbi:chromosomal replication initiator protein DnaA [Candidatus Roizmanbacteria bacterium RIFCSPLOWO2_02_FULL_43_10]|uniref:Chromosomal replication initiator protein DnaA n=2 Tax=Candidatus Roizmaniibacteriota TaxID=1752723 RepID=A0A1F7JVW5_9BACT|nr:MAG: chromosomal replication initiator protein DnaA [Candidatus Roizmanbacteria bacterium RIFCSPHIGHO2_02_FULL_43_11]OGK59753.1 MAG: chromosomal replication initiator protein DnaA [Candidatus Roizmanbacteria bacterium RIFCSPLOWO2_02_FULL_43_10]
MDWEKFVDYFSHKESFPVIANVLKISHIQKFEDGELVVSCVNLGAKQFLDGKRAIIESVLGEFTKKDYSLSFVVEKKKLTSRKRSGNIESVPISLMDFQDDLEARIRRSGIQPRFTFENFAVSPTNQMAHAAAQAVSKAPGKMYNPLFLYGTVGVGKTHLAQASGHAVLELDPQRNVLYCTSEQFTNDLVEAIRRKNTGDIRRKYRTLDMLIVDDTQFIAGKNYVQEEFYHTFNTLVQNGGQIILVSDRPPQEIKALEDRLRSRFTGGLIIDMQQPDFELRTAIVLIKAQERNIDIDMEAAQSIAEKITDSRELEGALLKLLSMSLMQSDSNKITADSANAELSRIRTERTKKIRPEDVIRTVAQYYELKPSHIKGPSRKHTIAFARQVIMYFLRHKMGLNLDEIAFIVKRKDHTTVLHGVGKIEGLLLHDDRFQTEVSRLFESISEV